VCYADTAEATAHFLAGDVTRAIALAERGLEAWRENGFVAAGLARGQSMLVIYRLAAGDTETAVRLLSEAETALADTVCTYHIALHHLLRAQVALAGEDRPEAVRRMHACLAHASNHKRMAVLTWARGFLPPLFALAWKEGIAREWLAGAIEEWEIPPPSRNEQDWPRALEIFVLGGFEVKRGGIRLDFGRKPPRRLISLLKAIAISGDRGLPSETACGYLWPDLDGDAAAASLTAALYRLRKLLGSPDAVRLVEGRLILPSSATWIDLHAFERLARSDDATDLEKAVSLHHGPLLPDDDEPWVTAIRVRVRDAFVRSVEALAEPMVEAEADVAARLYSRGVEVDPLAEGCYRGLMRCHARRGQIAEVASVYRRLRQTLSVILGIEPSAETERLRRRIIEGA
jgi:DNA-binding SARP family transcriptional activator